jgi:aromatic ring-opening dioxygenase LigB subunit
MNSLIKIRQLQLSPHLRQFLEEGEKNEENNDKNANKTEISQTSHTITNSLTQVLTIPISLIIDSNIAVAVEQRFHHLTTSSSNSIPHTFASGV